jgi:hypothetical protein
VRRVTTFHSSYLSGAFSTKVVSGFVSENALTHKLRPLSGGKPVSTFPESGLSGDKVASARWQIAGPRAPILEREAVQLR